jgi:hypothetical protein
MQTRNKSATSRTTTKIAQQWLVAPPPWQLLPARQ